MVALMYESTRTKKEEERIRYKGMTENIQYFMQ